MKTYTTVSAQKWVADPSGARANVVYRDYGSTDSEGRSNVHIIADCSRAGLSEDERQEIVAAVVAAPEMLRAIKLNIRLLEHIADNYDLDEDDQASLNQGIVMFRDALKTARAAD